MKTYITKLAKYRPYLPVWFFNLLWVFKTCYKEISAIGDRPNMFRIALCDDNLSFLEYEKEIIDHFMTKNVIESWCDVYLSGNDLIQAGDKIKKYDLFLLDCEMEGLSGFDTARKIYELYPEAKLAFATNYYDFTREGYKYKAVRYLVKQEKTFKTELIECISYVINNFSQDEKILELSDSMVRVRMDDIIYIGSDKHYIEYFLKNAEFSNYTKRCSLDDVQSELPEFFVRVHQRYIVNMKNAVQIKRNIIVIRKNEKETIELPIARNRYDETNRKFCLIKGAI